MRAPILLTQHGLGALEYLVPEGTSPGTIVLAPLGSRRITGVVWDEGGLPVRPVDESRLKPIVSVLPLPPLQKLLRDLIGWVADYYLAAPGSVLRMALPEAAFMAAPKPVAHFILGDIPGSLHPRRKEVVERLLAANMSGPAPLSVWAEAADTAPASLRPLVKAGILLAADPAPCAEARAPLPPGPKLREQQQAAADVLVAAVGERRFQPILLDGITGSGKTETYLEAVAAALAGDRQILVLLPEIALTESWLARFITRFGFEPVLWHSSLTPATRRTAFADIATGKARVVVGARSALFLPFRRLGLIIVDEAHDTAFKQEDGVAYNGRDVAVMRARFEAIPVVLSTATPPLETLEQVARGTYKAVHLRERHGDAVLPHIHLIDLTKTPPPRGRWIAPPLAEAITARLERREQSLLFLNRRGYAPLTLCRACGERIQCPNCTAWLVEHRHANRLQCHHCGHSIPRPRACPSCGVEDMLAACGPGVERLAEEVAAVWPEARAMVVTSDTLRTRADAAALATSVADGSVDILIGTQMLTKGHDFPRLTLVGVIDADVGLAGGDLRAAERTYQQIAQVAGRAGRGSLPGEVFIQTHQPRAAVMQALARHDQDGFLAAEREARLAAHMPPFGRLAALIISSADPAAAAEAARLVAMHAPHVPGIEVWGPSPAPLAMLRGRHRHRLLVHASRAAPLQEHIRRWLAPLKLPSSVRLNIDVDPQSFL